MYVFMNVWWEDGEPKLGIFSENYTIQGPGPQSINTTLKTLYLMAHTVLMLPFHQLKKKKTSNLLNQNLN